MAMQRLPSPWDFENYGLREVTTSCSAAGYAALTILRNEN